MVEKVNITETPLSAPSRAIAASPVRLLGSCLGLLALCRVSETSERWGMAGGMVGGVTRGVTPDAHPTVRAGPVFFLVATALFTTIMIARVLAAGCSW